MTHQPEPDSPDSVGLSQASVSIPPANIENLLLRLSPTIIKKRNHPWGIWLWVAVLALFGTPTITLGLAMIQRVPSVTFPDSSLEEMGSFLPTYIEILAGLLTFGVGIPSLLMSVPSRIRVLHRKHADRIRIPVLKKDVIIDDFFNPVIVSTTIVFSILIVGIWLIPCDIFPFNTCGLRIHLKSWFPTFILFANVLIVARFVMILRAHNKFEFLGELEKKIRSHINTGPITLEPDILESISELGQYSDAGSDKDTVLSTLSNLKNIQGLKYETQAKLAQSMRAVVVGGNADNFIVTIRLLQEMCNVAFEVFHKSSERDKTFITAIFNELEEVLYLAFAHRNPEVRATMLEAYERMAFQTSPGFARSFLRLGKEALRVKATRSAYAILGKFDTKIREIFFPKSNSQKRAYSNFSESAKESLYRFLGLLAYFWDQDNTARHLAHQTIEGFEPDELDEYLQDARDFFQDNGDIETADCLEQMLYEYHQFQYVSQFLIKINVLERKERERIALHYSSLNNLRLADRESISACGVSKIGTEALFEKLTSH